MSFLSSYLDYTASDITDSLWKKWTGITCLATTAGKKVWLTVGGRPVYGNTFALLVGDPAAGKGIAMSGAESLLPHMKDVHLSSDDTNVAVAVKQLSEAVVACIGPDNAQYNYNSLTVLSDEFGVFLPEYDKKMMNALQKLYDAKSYRKETMGRGEYNIESAYFTLLGACTPSYLQSTIPEEAWTQGFMSRTVAVYGYPQPKKALTEDNEVEGHGQAKNRALGELRRCARRFGHIRWHSTGIKAFNEWLLAGQKPAPTHPRLMSYNGRRDLTALKLTLLLAIDRGAERIGEDCVHDALALLFETEERMPDIFKSMRTGGDQVVMRELLHYMKTSYIQRGNKPVDKHKMVSFLADRVPAHNVERMIMIMTAAQAIKPVPGGYIPTKLSPEG